MAKPFEEGIQAKYKYQPVKYFPLNAVSGASYVLTSDPWSYLKAWLEQQATKPEGTTKLDSLKQSILLNKQKVLSIFLSSLLT